MAISRDGRAARSNYRIDPSASACHGAGLDTPLPPTVARGFARIARVQPAGRAYVGRTGRSRRHPRTTVATQAGSYVPLATSADGRWPEC